MFKERLLKLQKRLKEQTHNNGFKGDGKSRRAICRAYVVKNKGNREAKTNAHLP
jgi:hypothetical protein